MHHRLTLYFPGDEFMAVLLEKPKNTFLHLSFTWHINSLIFNSVISEKIPLGVFNFANPCCCLIFTEVPKIRIQHFRNILTEDMFALKSNFLPLILSIVSLYFGVLIKPLILATCSDKKIFKDFGLKSLVWFCFRKWMCWKLHKHVTDHKTRKARKHHKN